MPILIADFSGRVVVITGAASGMGKAAAAMLSDTGAKLALVDVNEAAVRELAAGIPGAIAFGVDVRDPAQVDGFVQETVSAHGRIDAFFNNAGILGHTGSLVGATMADYDRVFDVNVRGSFLCLAAAMRVMIAQRSGAIVNTASIAGLRGVANTAIYSASKFAMIGLTRSAAKEAGVHGVRINAICPGPTLTAFTNMTEQQMEGMRTMVPLGRLATVDDMAKSALWLLSDAAAFLNGVILPVDGGQTA